MKKIVFIAVICASALSMSGCSSTLGKTAKQGEYFTQDKSKSVAWNAAAFAGYPGMFSDHRYTQTIGNGVTMASNAIVLKNGYPSLDPASAASMGIGLGLITSLTEQFPLDIAQIMMVRLQQGESYTSIDAVRRTILENMKMRNEEKKEPTEELRSFVKNADINTVVCKEYSSMMDMAGFTHECYLPANPKFSVFVKAIRPANGSEFDGVWDLPAGQYGVMLVRAGTGGAFTPKTWNSMFHLVNSGAVMVYGQNTILPFASPREDGKRLIVKDGKAQYL